MGHAAQTGLAGLIPVGGLGAPAVPQPMVGTAVELPRGQCAGQRWIPQHYGPVPRFRPQTWDLRVNGATGSGAEYRFDWAAVSELPRCRVTADLHCVKKFTIPRIEWDGIAALTLLEAAPPAPEATHVMVWADYGYSANIRMSDFAAETTLLATGIGGEPLAPEHGYPLRLVAPHLYGWKSVKWVRAVEYLTADRRGFWEERGYHNRADPWREERYSYQEDPGQAPPL